MVELATIARPYAEALFRVAEGGDIAAWFTLVQDLAQIARLPEVLSVASSPKATRTQVAELLLAAVKSSLAAGEEAKNFVQMLVDNHRIALLPEVAEQFEALKNEREGAADAEIVSAFPLNGADLDSLVSGLERKFKRKLLKPTVEVDSSLIGGVRVTVGNEVLDTSVRARLASMQAALTA